MVEIELADGTTAAVKTIISRGEVAPSGAGARLSSGQHGADPSPAAPGADPLGWARSERATVGLAAVARRRRRGPRRPVRPHAAPPRPRAAADGERLVEAAPAAALDTVGVAVRGYAEAPRSETILFNLLAGFLGSFALVRLSTWGIRDRWRPVPQRPASAAATSTTSCRASCSPSPPAPPPC